MMPIQLNNNNTSRTYGEGLEKRGECSYEFRNYEDNSDSAALLDQDQKVRDPMTRCSPIFPPEHTVEN